MTTTTPDPAVTAARFFKFARRLACKLARELKIDPEDAISAGALGLMQAAARWDGVRPFQRFAYHRIRGEVLEAARHELAWVFHGGTHLGHETRLRVRAIRRLRQSGMSDDEIAVALGRPAANVEQLGAVGRRRTVPLAAAAHCVDPTADLERAPLRNAIFAALERCDLSDERRRQARVVLTTCALDDLTLKTAGARLGVSEARACQIWAEATRALRDELVDDDVAA